MARKGKAAIARLVPKTEPVPRTDPIPFVESWLAERKADGAAVVGVAIHWFEKNPADGSVGAHTWTAGINEIEAVALASWAHQRMLEVMRGQRE